MNSSMSFLPISRFVNELAIIKPTKPARRPVEGLGVTARLKNNSVNGTPSENFPLHDLYRSR